jgi:signal transduction histidine kinase
MVQDNGTEKETTNSDGMGINNMNMRAKKIGAELVIAYENGFRVELIVRVH